MSEQEIDHEKIAENSSLHERLIQRNYAPALAAKAFEGGEYARAVEICTEYLARHPKQLSAQLIYAKSLYYTGQFSSSSDQFYAVLSYDPDNAVALKYLGDILFAEGDEYGAMSHYERVLKLEPHGYGLKSAITEKQKQRTSTITLKRGEETSSRHVKEISPIPFYTETLGDLYLSQGHPRLAASVFEQLSENGDNPRLTRKLLEAEEKIQEKEK